VLAGGGLMAHKGKIVTLDLSNNNMGARGAQSMAEVVKKSRCLAWLNLYMNDMGDEVCHRAVLYSTSQYGTYSRVEAPKP